MQRLLLPLVTLLLPSLVWTTPPPYGTARQKLREDLLYICRKSSETIFGRMFENPSLFTTWAEEVKRVDGDPVIPYFHTRPYDTPRTSICHPMNTTCCKLKAEKHLAKLAQREYGELFLNVTHESIGRCFTVGRDFYHAMYSNFRETRRQLEGPINNILHEKMPKKLFNDFFSYLSSFAITSDLCDLSEELNAIMLKLFTLVYEGKQEEVQEEPQRESLRQMHPQCYKNVSTQIMESFYNELFNKLERQLYNLDLIYRAMELSEIVLERLKTHQFSPECTKPMTQLQNCGQCTGYFKFKPCLFYCINVFRGCLADVADIHEEFQLLTKALSDIPDDILPTFQPNVFIANSLHLFIELATDLMDRDLRREVADACSDGTTMRKKRSPLSRRQIFNTAVTPTTSTLDYKNLVEAFDRELHCMEEIGSLLRTIPEKMCYQSKQHKTIADTGNHRCWLGSGLGTYVHPETPAGKEAQQHNPEFRGGPPPYLNQYDELTMDISMVTAEINDTLDLVLCLDDEDCSAPPFYDCEPDPELQLQLRGSGSGSGSGSSSGEEDDGMRDMEDGDSTQVDDELDEVDVDVVVPFADAPKDDLTSEPDSPDSTDEGYTVYDISHGSGSKENATTDNTTASSSDATSTTPEIAVEIDDPGAGGASSRLEASVPLWTAATLVLLALA